jgi:hypothetical protein
MLNAGTIDNITGRNAGVTPGKSDTDIPVCAIAA